MPRLARDLNGVEPVDGNGNITGPRTRLQSGCEFRVTIPKLRRPEDSFEEYWSEIQVAGQLYRVPLKTLESAGTA